MTRTWTDPVHGVIEVAPFAYISAISDLLGGGAFSQDERRIIDLMWTERWREWATASQIDYMRNTVTSSDGT